MFAVFAGFWYIDDREPMHPVAATVLGGALLLTACVLRLVGLGIGFGAMNTADFFALAERAWGSSFLGVSYGVLLFALYKWLIAILKHSSHDKEARK